jgi:hypothetical protein
MAIGHGFYHHRKVNSVTSFFRELNAHEEADFRQWARENYVRDSEVKAFWHPVVRDECALINGEGGVCDV